MNIELILWIVASVVVVEIIFILFLKHDDYGELHWVGAKFLAIFIGVIFMLIQGGIVFGFEGEIKEAVANYMNLLYEGIIILGIFLFFYLNKQVAYWVGKK